MEENRHFNVLVAGENPEELMHLYDSTVKVEPYVAYEYSKAEDYKNNYISTLRGVLKELEKLDPNDPQVEYIREEIIDMEATPASDYYIELIGDLPIDEKTGNALSTENPNGKFTTCRPAGFFALPFILKEDGREVYSARKGEIDWKKIHLANQRPYEVAWDTVMGNKVPADDDERVIYENMKNRVHYFQTFGNREHYIASSTAFWNFAFVDNKGWHEIDGKEPQFDWVTKYYDRFVKPLPNDTKLTLFECTRPK